MRLSHRIRPIDIWVPHGSVERAGLDFPMGLHAVDWIEDIHDDGMFVGFLSYEKHPT